MAMEDADSDILGLAWPGRPDNFYFHFACQLCKLACQPPESGRRCPRCKLAAYCCQSHRRLDKPAHRPFCRAVRRHRKLQRLPSGVGLFAEAKGLDAAEFWRFRQRKMSAIAGLLGRQLAPWERQALVYPRLCCVCYSDRRLTLCPICLSAAYCCPDHRRQHEAAHRGNAVSHAKLFNAYLLLRELQHCCELPDPPLQLYQPRMACYEALERQPRLDLLNPDDAPALMLPLRTEPEAPASQGEAKASPAPSWVRQAFASEAASYPLTLLYVWEQVRPPPGPVPLSERTSLTVHVVGRPASASCAAKWELLLHRLPGLRQLRIVFLDVTGGGDRPDADADADVCPACTASGARLEFRHAACGGLFSSGEGDGPDAVCVFNLRRPLTPAAPDAVVAAAAAALLLPSGAPLLVTAESARMCRDLPRLLPAGVSEMASATDTAACPDRCWPNGVNPVFSCLPRRLPGEADGDPACCHSNWFLSVLWWR